MIHERCVRPRTENIPPPATPPRSGPLLVQFFNAKLVTGDGLVDGDLWMHGSTLVDPQSYFWERSHAKAADRRIDCQGMLLSPGMIDIMLYGAFGVDFSKCGEAGAKADAKVAADLSMVRRRLPELGVTAFCPAVRASAPDECARAIARLGRTATPPVPQGEFPQAAEATWARCLGVHLDGPFLDAEHAASARVPTEHVRATLKGKAILQACGGKASEAALITLAPELPGAIDAIRELVASGVVVGIGRTAASLAQCYDAVAAGARLVTHVMNSMPPFKHRDPGPVGLLADGKGWSEGTASETAALTSQPLIRSATGHHLTSGDIFFSLVVSNLHSCTVNLAHDSSPQGLILLSDLGPPSDSATMDATAVRADDEGPEAGQAGGAIPQCAHQLCLKTASPDPASALLCGSAHPARLLNLPNKGRLTAGADADLVLLDPKDLSDKACYVAGRLAWSHPNLHGALWFHL